MVDTRRILFILQILFISSGCSNQIHSRIVLFKSTANYNYRIPGIIVSLKGTLIAYGEQRNGISDWAVSNIVQRRSEDNGQTWSSEQIIVKGENTQVTINNPVMISDDNKLILVYCVNYGLKTKNGGIYERESTDDGITWSEPREILKDTNEFNVFATGPGHGIKCTNGRLIIPCWMVKKSENQNEKSHHPGTVCTIYSDDHGNTWIKGENVPQGNVIDPNESTIIELKDGYLLLNIRNQSETKCRAVSKSNSGIDNWSLAQLDTSLIDPVCFASAAKFKNKILFVNCNSRVKREKLSVQLFDNSFSKSILTKLIKEEGGYADIATDNKLIYLLHEKRETKKNANPSTSFSLELDIFNLDWLKN